MTITESKQNNIEWLKTVQVGDEVALTNTNNVLRSFLPGNLFGDMFGFGSTKAESPVEEICEILTIRGILDDGYFVVGNGIYTSEGTPISTHEMKVELLKPTDELRDLAWKLKFQKDVRVLEWKNFSKEAIEQIIKIINPEIEKMNEEGKNKSKVGK